MDGYLTEQLHRLGTDHLDAYLLHALSKDRWDKFVSLGVIDFINQAKTDGKIRYAGFSFHDTFEAFQEIIDAYDWDLCQVQYNYLDEECQGRNERVEVCIITGCIGRCDGTAAGRAIIKGSTRRSRRDFGWCTSPANSFGVGVAMGMGPSGSNHCPLRHDVRGAPGRKLPNGKDGYPLLTFAR